MNTTEEQALVIIDMSRGFMPASEGTRLGMDGFGELAVPQGDLLINNINDVTVAAFNADAYVGATRDAHPEETAHFAEEPNYRNTWPVHCVEGTPGFEYHPDLIIADNPRVDHFLKGQRPCMSPEDDDSYTGALAVNAAGVRLPEALRDRGVMTVFLAGVALGDGERFKLCVDSTAFDLHQDGFDVRVITDAVEAVLPENRELCLRNMAAAGIKLVTAAEAIAAFEG